MPHARLPIRLLATASTALVLGLPLLLGSVRPAAAVTLDPCLISPDQCSSLVVAATGDGTGLIETTTTLGGLQDNKITCQRTGGTNQGTCGHRYWVGTGKTLSVYLFEEPFVGSKFCEVGSCWTTPKTKTIVLPPNTIATFSPEFRPVNPVTLTVAKYGTGNGSFTTSPAGITCGAVCTFDFSAGTQVTITETADASSVIGGWSSGPCTGQGPSCTITLTSSVTIYGWITAIVVQPSGADEPPLEVGPPPAPTLPPAVVKTPAPTAGSVVIASAPPADPSAAPAAPSGDTGATSSFGDTAYGAPSVAPAPVPSSLDPSPVATGSGGGSDAMLIAVAIIVAGLLIAFALLARRRTAAPG